MRAKSIAGYLVCTLLLALALGVTPAQAHRELLIPEKVIKEGKGWLKTSEDPEDPIPPPEGEIEGACGLAVSPGPSSNLYVSDYYHHLVDVFVV